LTLENTQRKSQDGLEILKTKIKNSAFQKYGVPKCFYVFLQSLQLRGEAENAAVFYYELKLSRAPHFSSAGRSFLLTFGTLFRDGRVVSAECN